MSVFTKQVLFWVVDTKTLLDTAVFETMTTLLKQFNVKRSDVLPLMFSLADMINIHLSQQEGETLIYWLDNECKTICYRWLNETYQIDDAPEDLKSYLYFQQDRLICLLMAWIIELVGVLPDNTKEVRYLSFCKGWVVNAVVHTANPSGVIDVKTPIVDIGYTTL